VAGFNEASVQPSVVVLVAELERRAGVWIAKRLHASDDLTLSGHCGVRAAPRCALAVI